VLGDVTVINQAIDPDMRARLQQIEAKIDEMKNSEPSGEERYSPLFDRLKEIVSAVEPPADASHPSPVALLAVDKATVSPGGQVALMVTVTVVEGALAAYTVDVVYDDRQLVAVGAASNSAGICNHAFRRDRVRFVGATLDGLVGNVVLGTVTFAPLENAAGESQLFIEPFELVDLRLAEFVLQRVDHGHVTVV